jgi:predicted permease
MPDTEAVTSTVVAFSFLVALSYGMRRVGVFRAEDSEAFSRLLLELILPGVIFAHLATHRVDRDQLLLVSAMGVSEVTCLALVWMLGRSLRLPHPRLGSFLMAAGFSCSALMGYSVVPYIYPGDDRAFQDAVLVSELGNAMPFYTLAPVIAMHFGELGGDRARERAAILHFFRTPIFAALALGILLSPLGFNPQGTVLEPLFEAALMAGGATTLVAALIVGMHFQPSAVGRALPLVAAAIIVKLIAQPLVAGVTAAGLGLPLDARGVVVLEAAMPSAMLVPVFALRYRCDSELASALVMGTILTSMLTVPLAFRWFTVP